MISSLSVNIGWKVYFINAAWDVLILLVMVGGLFRTLRITDIISDVHMDRNTREVSGGDRHPLRRTETFGGP